MKRLVHSERGFALPMALGVIMVLGILGVAAATYTLTSGSSAAQSKGSLQALQYAESGLDSAYSLLWNANLAGTDPTTAGIIGTSSSPKVFCFIQGATCSTSGGSPGSASVYGCYGGTSGTTCNGNTVPSSTWWIVSTGYGTTNDGQTTARAMSATAVIHALNTQQAIGAVWNHIFLTAPLVPNVCQTNFVGNTLTINAPIYSIGNLCFSGNTDQLVENGDPVDLQVGGKVAFIGNTDSVGKNNSPITSGVSVGGCSTSITATGTACSGYPNNWYVKATGSYVSQDSPTLTNSQIEADYSAFDPGPKHTCLSGTTPAGLNANQLDYAIQAGEGSTVMPGNSGSGAANTAFNLTPTTSYACISQSGITAGYLVWNAGTSSMNVTSGGTTLLTVPAKTLAINGDVYFDSGISISQAMTYTGVGEIMASGQIAQNGNNTNVCAINTSCTFSNWMGNTGNDSMLTLASVCQSAYNCSTTSAAFTMNNNTQTFQGSLYTLPTAGFSLVGNTETVEGPMSIGTMTIIGNTPNFKPLPVIKNMPVGAPLPPNIGLTIDPMKIVH